MPRKTSQMKLFYNLDIAMVAYSPLANPGRPATFKKDDEKPLLHDELIKTIAKKHNVSPAQV